MLDYIISHYIYIYIKSYHIICYHVIFNLLYHFTLYYYTLILWYIISYYITIYIYIGGEIPCVCFSRVHHVFAWPIDTWDLEPGSRDNVGITTIHWNDSFYWNYDSYIEQSNDNVGIPTLRRKWCEEPKEVSS